MNFSWSGIACILLYVKQNFSFWPFSVKKSTESVSRVEPTPPTLEVPNPEPKFMAKMRAKMAKK